MLAYVQRTSLGQWATRASHRASQPLVMGAYCLTLAVCLGASVLQAQTNNGSLVAMPKIQFFTSAGAVCNGCKVYTYAAGTTTPLATYSDADLSSANANPVVLDSAGRAVIYLTRAAYKFTLTTSADVEIWTVDDVYDTGGLFLGTTRTANTVFAGPASGIPNVATFRALVAADLGALADIGLCEGRLTLTTGTPVTTADVTGATTMYFAPYKGNRCALYDGSAWNSYAFTERSLALGTLTSGLPYDVFLYNNSGTLTLEFTAWTNTSTRATALTTQDGVYVRSGATTRRYLGTFVTTSTTQTEDSFAKRLVWNYYNRQTRPMRVVEATNSWTYGTATYRQANGSTANQVALVIGLAEVPIQVQVSAIHANDTAATAAAVSIGEDSATTTATAVIMGRVTTAANNSQDQLRATYRSFPAVGYHFYTWLERGSGAGVDTWYGDNGDATLVQSGMEGQTEG